jgi:ubiquinone/menaquinone biosynthesis C-methylase UbiE
MTDRRFNPNLAERLERPERLTWLPPVEVLQAVGVSGSEVVADVGAGTGYFTFPLAKAVGGKGKVYALDSQPEMLSLLRNKLDASSANNIELVHAEADQTGLPNGICDLVFLANVWHEFPDRSAVLRESMRILKKSGRIAILDWRPDVEPEHGPPLSHRLSASSSVADLLAGGFKQPSFSNIGEYSWLVQAVAG